MQDLKVKEQFLELRAQGLSFARIAEQLGVSKPTLIEWSKKMDYQIQNLRAIHLESLLERYKLQKEHRIAIFGKTLAMITAELEKRDFSQLSTESLLNIVIKLSREAKTEEQPLILNDRPEDLNLRPSLEQWSV